MKEAMAPRAHPADEQDVAANGRVAPAVHRKRLVWNGVCGCRQFVSGARAGAQVCDKSAPEQEQSLGEVCEPLS